MIILYLISSISLSFMFACDIFILAHPHISKKELPYFPFIIVSPLLPAFIPGLLPYDICISGG